MKKRLLVLILLLSILIISGCVQENKKSQQSPPKDLAKAKDIYNLEMKEDTIVSFSYNNNIAPSFLQLSQKNRDLPNIQKEITKKGTPYTASENKFSDKSEEELKKLLGLKPNWEEIERKREEAEAYERLRYDLPDYFDWRDQHGEDYVTPVKDQMSCGSCWAFAGVGAMEGNANVYFNNPTLDPDLSEQDLVSCFHGSGCGGLYTDEFDEMLNYFVSPKVCTELCFPYTATNDNCINKCPNWQEDSWGINSWQEIPFIIDEIKNALITKGPLITGMVVYNDFFSYSGGIYAHTTDSIAGYHAVTIVGYGTYDGLYYWIVKNSWGEDWGENGYFKILMGDSGIDSMLMFAINSPNPIIPEQIICNDNDNDGYCNWGIGDKPSAGCPACDNLIKDCDDSNHNIFENCGKVETQLGTLNVFSNPSEADIYTLDQENGNYVYRDKTPHTFNLNEGIRTVKISKEEYQDSITEVNIVENETTYLEANLTLAPLLYSPDNNDIYRLGDTIEIIGTIPEHVESFSVFSRKGGGDWETDGIILFNNGTGNIVKSTIAFWDTSVESEADFYSIKLEVYYGLEQSDVYVYDIYLDPTLKEGWPVKVDFFETQEPVPWNPTINFTYWAGLLEPVVADINNNGEEEIIFYKGGIPPRLYVYEQDGSLLWEKDMEINQEGAAGGNLHIPIVGNMDSTDDLEILVHFPNFDTKKSYLYLIDSQGNTFNNFPVEIPFNFHPTLAMEDLNLDGNKEIIVKGNGGSGKITIVNKEGSIISSWNLTETSWGGTIVASPAFGNFDNDPELEIVIGKPGPTAGGIWIDDVHVGWDNTGEVSVYNLDGSLVPGWPINPCGIVFSSPAVGDINNDGQDDIVFGTMYGTMDGSVNDSCGGLYAVDRGGNTLPGWPFEKGQEFWSSPSLIDLDGDNYLEIGISKLGFPPKTYILNYDGSIVEGWPEYTGWFNYYSTTSGDITNDQVPDLIATAGGLYDGGVYAWESNGLPVEDFPKVTEVDAQAPATISDIDGDGKLELIASSDWDYDSFENEDKLRGTVYVWELEGNLNQETMHWPNFHHDTENTGLYSSQHISCENSTSTSCGDIFPPDCNSVGQQVCCGDQEPETYIFKQCRQDLYPAVNCEDDTSLHVCCDNSDYMSHPQKGIEAKGCTDGNTCFAPTELFDVDNDGHTEDCWWETWYDPDDNPDHCYIYGGCEEADIWAGPEANCPEETKRFFVQEGESGNEAVFGEYGNGNMYECEGESSDQRCYPYNCDSRTQDCYECCGDDEGEYLISGNGFTRCCNSPNDKIDVNGNCQPKGKQKLISEIQAPMKSPEQENVFSMIVSFFKNLF